MAGTLGQGPRLVRVASGLAHVAGAGMAGAIAGGLLAALGRPIPPTVSSALLLLATAAYVGAELRLWSLPVPETGRQVPASWRYRYPPVVTAFIYGALLSPGVGTRIPFPSFVIVLSAAALSASVLIIGVYGTSRGLAAIGVANLNRRRPQIDLLIGLRYGWLLKLAVTITACVYLGAAAEATVRIVV